MRKQYKTMTKEELHDEILLLAQHIRKAKEENNQFELPVYEQKMLLVRSYLLDPNQYQPDEIYTIDEEPGSTFRIHHLKGVFAWGYRNQEKEMSGIPIAKLATRIEPPVHDK